MTTTVFNHNPGRSLSHYDLADEIAERYGLTLRQAHDAIHALLADLVNEDGEDTVILQRTPVEPALLEHNPRDLDINYWLTISTDAENTIREVCAHMYAEETETDD